MKAELEKVEKCYICGNEKAELLMSVRDRWYGLPGEFNLMKCTNCCLIYTNPRPTPETISLYYPKSYGPHQFETYNNKSQINEVSKGKKIKLLFKSLCDTRSQYLPAYTPGARLLEIGCSYGSFLNRARSKGWEVYGVEIAEEPANYGQEVLNLNIHQGTLESAGYPDNFFDVVAGWMVLEHLHDPLGTLKEVHRICRPGGIVAFGVPNVKSWEFRVFSANWFALEVPRHLSHFSAKSIQELFNRSGVKLERIYYQKNIGNIPASLALLMEERLGSRKLCNFLRNLSSSKGFHRLTFPIAVLLSWIKMTGRITVVGKICKN